ncbi:hypothetical protein [Hyalangium rubrum]|uniref:Lipoprotein n=1 Tax=Hyalangium rubrum TaxID=3103134 RepID=A0ABU5H1G3_9BACT|nr:hypothetical protein [Hyalangium sp. s54d21]MDY7226942.1 hypothetical protein [Hyalangium sp. s54d21]
MLRLLAFLGLPVMLLVALLTFCHSPSGRPRNLVPVLLALGLEAALLLGAAWEVSRLRYPVIDYVPDFSTQHLVGVWESRVGSLSLNADGMFLSSTGEQGQWSVKGDQRSSLKVGRDRWCVIRVDGQLQLLRPEDCPADPDNWFFSRAFSRRR